MLAQVEGQDDQLPEDPLWYKHAVIYQVHVRAFADSNGDGIGDFRGLTERLDYIQDLGATAIWVLPFYPSPLRDGGYDIADFVGVNPEYGTLQDVRTLVREAHARGMRVITELVLNHSSDQHPWFQRARRAEPGSKWRDFYVWSDTPERYKGTRIIFTDSEQSNWTWDPIAKSFFWHRFYHHQPDLNWDNPVVEEEMFRVLDFWLDLGIDGVRLDAVPYLIEREGTTCENLDETHAVLKRLRAHVDNKFGNRMLLAEANQWPEDACAYFGDGDECHMNFHFPVMPRLFMAVQTAERYPIIDILEQTPSIPDNCQWAIFLRNHDELTLEMVTDEERDYMYRKYAPDLRARLNLGIRRRLAPLLGNDRHKIQLLNGLLLSMAGTPIVYYGDEIGMGDNIYLNDRDGVRTPMQWNADRNAGFSSADPQKLYLPVITDPEYRYEAVNVETQEQNRNSLYQWMRRAIALRHRYPVFGSGEIEFLFPDNSKVLVYVRRNQEQTVLVVANLAGSVEPVELDLRAFEGCCPLEIFGGSRFPKVGAAPYVLTLGPHAFYWFDLSADDRGVGSEEPVSIRSRASFHSLLSGQAKRHLQAALLRALPEKSWFAGKARPADSLEIFDVVPCAKVQDLDALSCAIAMVRVHYRAGDPEQYALPLAWAEGEKADRILQESPDSVLVQVQSETRRAVMYDALHEPEFLHWLVELVGGGPKGAAGKLVGLPSNIFESIRGEKELLPTALLPAGPSNSVVAFGDQLVLKLFRKLQPGINPEYEIGAALTESSFTASPKLAGAIEYQPGEGGPTTIAVLQSYVANEGNAWQFTLDHVEGALAGVLQGSAEVGQELATTSDLSLAALPADESSKALLGSYASAAERMGERSGQMHLALAAAQEGAFAPEEFTGHYLRGLFQAMRNQAATAFAVLRTQARHLPEPIRGAADELLGRREEILAHMKEITASSPSGRRIRCHGDYHLGQLLRTGDDFAIIDFEGESACSIGARQVKQSPLRDVASMLRSLNRAAEISCQHLLATSALQEGSAAWIGLEEASRLWALHARAAFLRGYFLALGDQLLVPPAPECRALLRAFALEKALGELERELNHQPARAFIVMAAISDLLREGP